MLLRKIISLSCPTVEQMAAAWLKHCRISLKRSTYSTYSRIIKAHINPALGEVHITKLSIGMIDNFINNLAFPKDRMPLTNQSICLIETVLIHILRFAADQGLRVISVKYIKRPKKDNKEIKVLNLWQMEKLKNYCLKNMDYETLGILFSLYMGLRIGEVCGLKWCDINNDMLAVSRTVQRISNPDTKAGASKTILIIDTPKSTASMRTIPVPNFILEAVNRLRRNGEAYVLTGDKNHFLEPRTFERHFKRILGNAGLEEINYHALRHSFATYCVSQGFDPKLLSIVMGHSSVNTTFNTYVHRDIETIERYMKGLS